MWGLRGGEDEGQFLEADGAESCARNLEDGYTPDDSLRPLGGISANGRTGRGDAVWGMAQCGYGSFSPAGLFQKYELGNNKKEIQNVGTIIPYAT